MCVYFNSLFKAAVTGQWEHVISAKTQEIGLKIATIKEPSVWTQVLLFALSRW